MVGTSSDGFCHARPGRRRIVSNRYGRWGTATGRRWNDDGMAMVMNWMPRCLTVAGAFPVDLHAASHLPKSSQVSQVQSGGGPRRRPPHFSTLRSQKSLLYLLFRLDTRCCGRCVSIQSWRTCTPSVPLFAGEEPIKKGDHKATIMGFQAAAVVHNQQQTCPRFSQGKNDLVSCVQP